MVEYPTTNHFAYRPDVDGLRAVAVLAVMFFHADEALLPGGFLGVDVFFVISGFLITRNMLQEVMEDRFSICEFYRRRVKRIAPVMVVVVGLTLLASQLLLLPEDARATAKSALFALLSLANVFFWYYQDTSYFAPDSSQVPLLHLWSLGVEEQFYLLWPATLLLFYRRWSSKATLAVILTVAVAASFALGDLLYSRSPEFVYYMLITRAGELLLGAIVAIAVLTEVEGRVSRALAELLAALGAIVLAMSLVCVTARSPLPGWRAALPCAAVALLILTGHYRKTFWARFLSARWLVAIGLVSYSAYLWHWPLLALFRYGYGEPGPVAVVGALAATLVLAWLSYRYVEQPARRSRAPFSRVLLWQYVVPAGVLISLSLVVIFPQRLGLSLHSAAYLRHLDALRDRTRPAYHVPSVCQRQRIRPEDLVDANCVLGSVSSSVPHVILWGDSHAAHYIGVIDAIARRGGFTFRNLEVGACPPLLSDPTAYVDSRQAADCRASLDLEGPMLDQYSVVIVSSAWLGYESGYLPAFFDTASSMAKTGKLVVILGEVPWAPGYDRRCREKALSFPLLQCTRVAAPPSADVLRVNTALRRFADETPNVRYFDISSYVCPDNRCTTLSRTGDAIYYDKTHLSLAASEELGREVLSKEGVPEVFRDIATWQSARPKQDR